MDYDKNKSTILYSFFLLCFLNCTYFSVATHRRLNYMLLEYNEQC